MKSKTFIFHIIAGIILMLGMSGANAEANAEKQEKAPPVSQASAEPATGEEINWQVISSGGTEGSSASFGLQGTVGQTAVGGGTSDNYGLTHGFWQDFGGGTCCMGPMRGNVDYDVGDAIDISDLVFLVDYMFTSGPAPTCWEEANVDGSGPATPPDDGADDIDISDLVHLVDYMFNQGPPPVACP